MQKQTPINQKKALKKGLFKKQKHFWIGILETLQPHGLNHEIKSE